MANRTVSVALELQASQYKGEADAVIAKTEEMDHSVEKLDKDIKDLGPDAAKAAAEMTVLGAESGRVSSKVDDLGAAMKKTDAEIERSKALMKELADEFGRTGDLDLIKKFTGEQGNLSRLERFKGELEKLKTEADKKAAEIGNGFWGRLFSLGGKTFANDLIPTLTSQGMLGGKAFGEGFMGKLKPFAWPAAVAFGIPLLAALGATIDGALLTGTGLGALAVGVAAQLNDSRVHAAISTLGAWAKDELDGATSSFAPALLSGLGALKREAQPFFDSIAGPLHDLAPYVANLLARLGEGLGRLGPGLGSALNAAGPLLERFGSDLSDLLGTVGDFFDKLARGSKGGGEALHTLMRVIEGAITILGDFLLGASKVYDVMLQISDVLTGLFANSVGKVVDTIGKLTHTFQPFKAIHHYVHDAAHSMDGLGISAKAASGPTGDLANAADRAGLGAQLSADNFSKFSSQINASRQDVDALAGQMVDKLVGGMLSMDQAALGFDKSLITLGDTLVANGGHLSDHVKQLKQTETGAMQNKDAIYAVIQANLTQYDSMLKVGLSAEDAAAKYDQNTKALEDQLRAAGWTQAAIDGLIGKYRNVPKKVDTDIAVNGLTAAISNLDETLRLINNLPLHTDMWFVGHVTGEFPTGDYGGGGRPRAMGGITEHAAIGALREADTFSAVSSGARYAFAEPQTGGEAFIPRYGDLERSRSIWSYVGQNWLGMRPGGGGVANINLTISAGPGGGPLDQAMAGWFMGAVRQGQITLQTDQGARVKVA